MRCYVRVFPQHAGKWWSIAVSLELRDGFDDRRDDHRRDRNPDVLDLHDVQTRGLSCEAACGAEGARGLSGEELRPFESSGNRNRQVATIRGGPRQLQCPGEELAVQRRRHQKACLVEDGRIVRLVEKPQEPISNLAVIGIYYVRKMDDLYAAIEEQMRRGLSLKNEYFIADAIQLMIDAGARVVAMPVTEWEDCGNARALLSTNRFLLERQAPAAASKRWSANGSSFSFRSARGCSPPATCRADKIASNRRHTRFRAPRW